MPQKVTDTCPRCLRREVQPEIDAEDYAGNPHTSYRCPACRHVWFAIRAAEPEPAYYAEHDDPDAWEADDDFNSYDRERGWSE